MSRSYPIWVDTHNNAYSNSGAKSQGIRDYAQSRIYIGTSASNSYQFGDYSISHNDNGKEKNYNFYVDGELMKTATYNKNKKKMESKNYMTEEALKEKYFDKWKKEEQDAEQEFRNERYAERLRLNGGYNVK